MPAREESATKTELLRIEVGYCKVVDVYRTVKPKLVGSLTKAGFSTWLTRHPDIEAPKVVVWLTTPPDSISPFETYSRGVNKETCIDILRELYKDGIIKSGWYKLPRLLGGAYVVKPVPLEEEAITYPREQWTDEAKDVVASGVKEKCPAKDIVTVLVGRELRKDNLTVTTLARQIHRMAGDQFSEEEYNAYREEFRDSPSSIKRHTEIWTENHYVELVKVAAGSLKLSETSGAANCAEIGLILEENGVRISTSAQSIRHALRKIMQRPMHSRYGLTEERFIEINNPRDYTKLVSGTAQGKLPLVTEEVRNTARPESGFMVNGFMVVLTTEQKKSAIREYMTPERCDVAYQTYVDSRFKV